MRVGVGGIKVVRSSGALRWWEEERRKESTEMNVVLGCTCLKLLQLCREMEVV